MVFYFYTPRWFVGLDSLLELYFTIVLILISIFSYRIYIKMNRKTIKFFSIGFLMIGLSYINQSIFNLIIHTSYYNIPRMMFMRQIFEINLIFLIISIILKIIGLILLVFVSLRIFNLINLFLFIIISLGLIFYSRNFLVAYSLLSILYLIVINIFYFKNNILSKKKTYQIPLAFMFLFLSSIAFYLIFYLKIFFVLSILFEFIAYTILLIHFINLNLKIIK